jgi:hypothetical protein
MNARMLRCFAQTKTGLFSLHRGNFALLFRRSAVCANVNHILATVGKIAYIDYLMIDEGRIFPASQG